MRFEATEAALEGLRLARREPMAMLIWTVLLLAFSVISTGIMIGLFPGLLGRMETAETSGDPTMVLSLLSQMGQMYALLVPIYIAFYAVLYCACYRAVLRPEDKGFAFIKLGGDELRMVGLMLYQFVVWVGLCIGLSVIIGIIAVAAGFAAGAAAGAGGTGAGAGIGAVLLVIALYIAFIAVAIFIGVRLSLAAPKTFAEKKISLFGAWRLTKGEFWPLLGCYVLAWVIGIVVSLLGSAISMVGFVIVGEGNSFDQIFSPDMSSLAAYFTAGRIVTLLIASLFSALAYAIFVAPAAAAYRDIAGDRRAD